MILAGGKSTRLGRDKAALDVGGRTLLARTADLASRFCPLVAVSGRDPAPYGVHAPWFPDEMPGIGPIAGVITALSRFRTACLVLSCDLPFLDQATLERLMEAWRTRPPQAVITTFEQDWTGHIESLVAIYEPEAEALLRGSLPWGNRISRALTPDLRCVVRYGRRELRPFFNVNTPEDLAALRQDRREPTSAGIGGRRPAGGPES